MKDDEIQALKRELKKTQEQLMATVLTLDDYINHIIAAVQALDDGHPALARAILMQ